MHSGRPRERGILLAVVLLLLSGAVLVPLTARSQGNEVWGVVSSCADPTQLVPSVVTLVDAHARSPDQTADASSGVYRFTPPAGHYLVRVQPNGFTHFTAETGPFRFDDTVSVQRDVCVDPMPTKDLTLTVTIRDVNTNDPISEAIVTALNATRSEPIALPVTTNATGNATFAVWASTVNVKVEASMYQPRLVSIAVAADTETDITLTPGRVILVVVSDASGRPVSADVGLTGVLINTGAVAPELRVLRGIPDSNTLTFYAYDATYLLVVDGDQLTAATQSVTVSGSNQRINVQLDPSPQERFVSTVAFNGGDWNNVTVYRNVTLLGDSEFPAIGFTGLRNLRWQLDLAFGNADGALSASELAAFQAYLEAAGPFHVVTQNFLTVDGKAFVSKTGAGDFSVTVTDGPGTNLTIATATNYVLADPASPVTLDEPTYFVNVTTIADTSGAAYKNNTVFVELPQKYEMTSRTATGNVTTRGFTAVEVDPGVDATVPNPRVDMVVEFSLTGVARAEVEGPVGSVSVRDSDQEKYLAWVANDTAIVFSANRTTDRDNEAVNAEHANFTWRFFDVSDVQVGTAYGIWTTFDFESVGGNYSVNLTVTQVNPANVTYREINVTVDHLTPTANVRTNRTGAQVNPEALTVREAELTTFNAADSTDLLFADVPGGIAEYNWDFDGDGTVDRTGASVSWNYSAPGRFNATLYVVDFVGHRSENRTINVTVDDVSPPDVDFVVLDPENNWRVTNQLVEGHTYYFNASATTDNSLEQPEDNVNLTFRWQFGDGSAEQSGTGLINVSHSYARFGQNYRLNLTATDASGNEGVLNRTIVVSANTTAHPDLSILAGTLTISPTPSPTDPQEGQTVTFRFNVTNGPDKTAARDLRLQFAIIEDGVDQNQTVDGPRFFLADGSATTEIAPGANVTVEFTWRAPDRVGNFSLKIRIWDGDEPDAWVTTANEIRESLLLREAWWKFPLIVGIFLFIVVGLPILYYVVRKVRAGELALPKRRRADEEGDVGDEDDEGSGSPRKRRL